MSSIEFWKSPNVSANSAATRNAHKLDTHPQNDNCNVWRNVVYISAFDAHIPESQGCKLDVECIVQKWEFELYDIGLPIIHPFKILVLCMKSECLLLTLSKATDSPHPETVQVTNFSLPRA